MTLTRTLITIIRVEAVVTVDEVMNGLSIVMELTTEESTALVDELDATVTRAEFAVILHEALAA